MKLQLESLESRVTPTLTLTNGVLFAYGTDGPDTYQVNTVNNMLQVTENGVATTFNPSQVTNGVIVTRGGNDNVENNTSTPFTVLLGAGNDVYVDGTGNDYIDGGAGKDVIYALLGNNTVVSKDSVRDRVFVGATTTVVKDSVDTLATFFANGRTPGSNLVVKEGSVLYITPPNTGSLTTVFKVGNKLAVNMNGSVTMFNGITLIAYFGGSGDDVFVNNTNVESVAYGGVASGNDTLVGGFSYNLLKGGNGQDTIFGRGFYNDLAGNGGNDRLFSIAATIFRTDGQDVVAQTN